MGGTGRELAFASSGPTVILMAGLQGSGKTTACAKLARYLGEQRQETSRSPPATSTGPPRSSSWSRSASAPAPTSTSRGPTPTRSRSPPGRSTAPATERRDVLIVDTAGRLHIDQELMAELARDPQADQAARRAARRRRDDRPGRGRRRRVLRRGGRVRRRRDDQARRRRPRRRRALGQGGHRQADPLRLDRREARGLRTLPPRPHGLAHPRHGRRPQPDRESRAAGRREAGRGPAGANSKRTSSRSRTSSSRCARCAKWARSAASSGCCRGWGR